MKREMKIFSSIIILIGLLNITNVLGKIPIEKSLILKIDSSDIWWIVLISIVGFFCCLSFCFSVLFRFLRPWHYRRRGLPPPARRHFVRWWRRVPPPGHPPRPRPRWRPPPRGPRRRR